MRIAYNGYHHPLQWSPQNGLELQTVCGISIDNSAEIEQMGVSYTQDGYKDSDIDCPTCERKLAGMTPEQRTSLV